MSGLDNSVESGGGSLIRAVALFFVFVAFNVYIFRGIPVYQHIISGTAAGVAFFIPGSITLFLYPLTIAVFPIVHGGEIASGGGNGIVLGFLSMLFIVAVQKFRYERLSSGTEFRSSTVSESVSRQVRSYRKMLIIKGLQATFFLCGIVVILVLDVDLSFRSRFVLIGFWLATGIIIMERKAR